MNINEKEKRILVSYYAFSISSMAFSDVGKKLGIGLKKNALLERATRMMAFIHDLDNDPIDD